MFCVLKKNKKSNFFERVKKRSKLSENDIHMYLRLSSKYDAKLSSQKKVMEVQIGVIPIAISIVFFGMGSILGNKAKKMLTQM